MHPNADGTYLRLILHIHTVISRKKKTRCIHKPIKSTLIRRAFLHHLSPHALLRRLTFPLPGTSIFLPPHPQIFLGAPILLHHQAPQPLVLCLQASNALLQLERLILQILGRLLKRLFALLLLDAEARRGGCVAATFVFFGGEAGGGGFGLGGVVVGGWTFRWGGGEMVSLGRVGGGVEGLFEGNGRCGGGVYGGL